MQPCFSFFSHRMSFLAQAFADLSHGEPFLWHTDFTKITEFCEAQRYRFLRALKVCASADAETKFAGGCVKTFFAIKMQCMSSCRRENMQKKPIPSKKWAVCTLSCRAYRFSWRKYSDIEGDVSPLDGWYYGNKSLSATLRRLGTEHNVCSRDKR